MHEYITFVADRAASREVDALHDFYGVGRLIVSRELSYEVARDQMVAAFTERNLAASTAKVYVSQGYGLAQLFDTFEDVCEFADDECKGSRSLKRIYDATRRAAKADEGKADEAKADAGADEGEGDAAATAAPTTDADRADAILAILASMTDAAQIARVRDAASAMLRPTLTAAAV